MDNKEFCKAYEAYVMRMKAKNKIPESKYVYFGLFGSDFN